MALIALLMEHRGNRGQLMRQLSGVHDVRGGETVGETVPDVVLADRRGLTSGADLLAAWRAQAALNTVPVLLLVRQGEQERALYELGDHVDDVATMPISRLEVTTRIASLARIRSLLQAQAAQSEDLSAYNKMLEKDIASATAELKQSFAETVATLTEAAEYKDPDTGDHVRRVAYFTMRLASQLGCDTHLCEHLYYAAPMHDIGKIGIPESILLKPGRLTSEEWATMKTHTTIGHSLLKGHSSPYTQLGAEIALTHHEKHDGSGYPDGKAGDAVPLVGYLMSVADIYDALRSPRPYKAGMPHAKVCAIIEQGDDRTRPSHFHPDVLNAFHAVKDDFADIYDAHAEPEHIST